MLFNYFLVKTLDLYSKWGLSPEFKVIIPITLAGLLGFVLPEVLGGGHHLINKLRAKHLTLTTLSILLIVKFIFTMLSYGSGAPGGIFLPLLVIGALTRNIYGDIINKLLHIDSAYINNFIVLSMAAYFTAIVKAPITGSILITEMTGSFSHLFALATVSMTAYLVTELLHSRPVYEILLERVLKSRGVCELGTDCKKMIIEIPVCLGSELDQKKIRDIKWPKDCLLVGIKRGENEIIPNGNTLIQVGDYLVVLTNEDKEVTAKKVLSLLAGECNI